ncbi:MAG: bifunctional (p)ppGpp synthetase/guanosine-3',5'-bis(diphosphate) 3'-pyrophosphohydrolase, partial [Coriobacteriia bacterium]|nr:bifunctional (p)ppGpp synthetase/guanosine-3',5'-bis(diphosphate) 3'-pyrophosphohydrolase [Coriobacteriia bacterium]
EVGHHCVGAKVNGSIVTLDYELQMGDRVEILTNKSSWPSRDWLSIVRTSSARSKIRSYFSRASREDDLAKGKEELGKILRKQGMHVNANTLGKALDAVAKDMNLQEGDDLLASIGGGKQSPKQVVTKLIKVLAKDGHAVLPPEPEPAPTLAPAQPSRRKSGTGVRVKGIDDVLVRLAHCCNPVPGDTIVGFVTRGRGVSVHREDCPNARELVSTSPERILEVEWDTAAKTTYQVEILIEALDRTRLLQDISIVLADAGVNVLSAAISTDRQGVAYLRFLFELGSMDQLQKVLATVRGVNGVFDARRTMPDTGKKRGGAQ